MSSGDSSIRIGAERRATYREDESETRPVRPDQTVQHARKRNPYRRSAADRELEGSATLRDDRALQPKVSVRKAVFPVAGLDTDLLPATKAAPKEMLTVVDKPLIHYAVEEAAAAGIREMIFVTNRNKRAIEDHFDMAYELEATLANEERIRELEQLQRLFPPDVRYLYVRQREYTGLGSALRCARPLVGDEPFALILPDELIDSDKPAIAQLLDTFHAARHSVIGVQRRGPRRGAAHGVKVSRAYHERVHEVAELTRPEADAMSDGFTPAGRYVLTPSIFRYLESSVPAVDIGLHEALQGLLAHEQVLSYEIAGERFDCRTKLGLLRATVHYALKHPELAAPFRELLSQARNVPTHSAGAVSTHA